MFINDIVDVESKEKKSHRVRSWYLYEQFKSLERNQLDAAQKLKERSYQDKILFQELQERRTRRKLYDQCDLSCKSECQMQGSTSDKGALSASSDDFFESFCEFQDDGSIKDSEHDSFLDETFSQDDSQIGKRYLDEFKSLDGTKDDQSYAESVNSVVENCKSSDDLAADLSQKLLIAQKNIANDINQQEPNNLGTFTKTCGNYKIQEVDSTNSLDELELKHEANCNDNSDDINVCNMWSKFVSFAYQVIQLNHAKEKFPKKDDLIHHIQHEIERLLREATERKVRSTLAFIQPLKMPSI
ncbi:unnamed protein product [Diatraea saccharalis]|uniref:Uncharacterized protein n=1 Tax=Diatraea saccharalis TaxID=40085 RepID=A0A9N9QZ62_9NEOP|nr:unnamed protein product [Diatraea saccharalis]